MSNPLDFLTDGEYQTYQERRRLQQLQPSAGNPWDWLGQRLAELTAPTVPTLDMGQAGEMYGPQGAPAMPLSPRQGLSLRAAERESMSQPSMLEQYATQGIAKPGESLPLEGLRPATTWASDRLGDVLTGLEREGMTAGEVTTGAAMRGETLAHPNTPYGVAEGLARGLGRFLGEAATQGPAQAVEGAIARREATPEQFPGQKGISEAVFAPSNLVGLGEVRAAGKAAAKALAKETPLTRALGITPELGAVAGKMTPSLERGGVMSKRLGKSEPKAVPTMVQLMLEDNIPIKRYYHVTGRSYREGHDLLSYEKLREQGWRPRWKWGGAAGGIDAEVVSLHDNLDDALAFRVQYMPRGKVLAVDLPADVNVANEWGVSLGRNFEGYPIAQYGRIPAGFISDVTDEVTRRGKGLVPESKREPPNRGTEGGQINPLLAARLGSTVAGGAVGYATAPEEDRLGGALRGAVAGAALPGLAHGLARGGFKVADDKLRFSPQWFARAEERYKAAAAEVERLGKEIADASLTHDVGISRNIVLPPADARAADAKRTPLNLVGLTRGELEMLAADAGVNPYEPDWWGALDPEYVRAYRSEPDAVKRAGDRRAAASQIDALARDYEAAEAELRAAEAELNEALEAPEGALGPERAAAPDPVAEQRAATEARLAATATAERPAEAGALSSAPLSAETQAAQQFFLGGGKQSLPQVPKPKGVEGARPITLTREEEVARLRLDKFPEELRETLAKSAERIDFARAQRRGVVSDQAAEDAADRVNRTVEEWIKGGKAGRAYNTEETRALRNALVAQAEEVKAATRELGEARARGEDTEKMLVRAFVEGEKLQALQTVAEGARAEWGRAGRAFQIATRSYAAPTADAVQRIYKKVGGRENAIKAVEEFGRLREQGADPIQMARFWARVEKPPVGAEDWFRALRYNSMLSGPRTFEINLIGNSLEVPWRLARDAGSSLARRRPEELAPEITGMWAGMQKGARAALEVLREGITVEQALRGDLPRDLASRLEGKPKRVAQALEAPGKLMMAADELARQTAYGMALGRYAGMMASKEGKRGAVWSARVAEIMADPPRGLQNEALATADRMTYHNDMGNLGRALGGVQQVPYIGNLLMPFLRTVYNITARGIDRSPLGLVGTALDVKRGVYQAGKELPKGVVPLGERLGDNLMGTLAGAFFTGYALQGGISGAGPDDPQRRDLLRAQGWQPYSIKVGDNWVSYSNWGPVSIALAQAAAMAETAQYRPQDANAVATAADAFRRFGELTTEQVYLQGLGNIYKAISDPQQYGGRWLTAFFQTLIPYGAAINTLGQAGDSVSRTPESGNIAQAMAARLPGLRQSVPATQDVLGRAVPNQYQGAAAFQPLRASASRQDPVLAELTRVGVDISRPPRTWGGVPLSNEQQRRFQRLAGPYISKMVQATMDKPAYAQATPVEQAKELERVVRAVRDVVGDALLEEMIAERMRQKGAAGATP